MLYYSSHAYWFIFLYGFENFRTVMLFDNMSLLDKNVVGSKYLGAKKFQHRDPLDQGLVTDF